VSAGEIIPVNIDMSRVWIGHISAKAVQSCDVMGRIGKLECT
jgi:hypothetical protein